jgi:hypothetical protein
MFDSASSTCGPTRLERTATAKSRRAPPFRARSSRRRCIELLLLPRHSENERGDRHHPAVHCASPGAALHGLKRTAASHLAAGRGGGNGGRWNRIGDRPGHQQRLSRSANRDGCGDVSCALVLLLQHRRTQYPRAIRPLDCAFLHYPERVHLLAAHQSTLEDRRRALLFLRMGISAPLRNGLRARPLFFLFRRTEVSRADARHRRQLP